MAAVAEFRRALTTAAVAACLCLLCLLAGPGAALADGGPTASILSPADGQVYTVGEAAPTSFTCAEASGGPGLASCTDDGAVAATQNPDGTWSGSLDTTVPGLHTYTVTATSTDGQTGTAGIGYIVAGPPTVTVDPLPGSKPYAVGQAVAVTFTCTDVVGLASCVDSNGVAAPAPGWSGAGVLDTSSPGTHTYSVTATSLDGLTAAVPVTYTVAAPPTVTISWPADGQTLPAGAVVHTSFACVDGAGGTGIASCADSLGGRGGSGTLNTSTEGTFAYTVTGVSADGQTGAATVHYTVRAGPPTISVAAPADGAAYFWRQLPAAGFSCAPGAGGRMASCTASVDGGAPFPAQASLPDTLGPHTMTVTAVQSDGQTATQTLRYTATLRPAPGVSIASPAQNAVYSLGRSVAARYSCSPAAGGAPLRACSGEVADGRPIDTGTLGRHTFTVTATDAAGTSSLEQVAYTVVPTTNRFRVGRAVSGRRGVARVTLVLPGPGTVVVVATAWNRAARGGRFVYARVLRRVRSGGRLGVTVAPNARGRRLVRLAGARPVLSLAVTYRPIGGAPRSLRARRIALR